MKRTFTAAVAWAVFTPALFGQSVKGADGRREVVEESAGAQCGAVETAPLASDSWTGWRAAGLKAYDRGDYRTAEADLNQSMAAVSSQNGSEASQALVAADLAAAYQVTGRYKEAEALLEEAEHRLAPDAATESPAIAVLLYRKASLWAEEGKYEAAEPLAVRALAELEQEHAPATERAAAFRTLADIRVLEDRFEESHALHTQILTIDQAESAKDIGKDLAALGRDDYKLGRMQEAEQLLEKAMDLYQRSSEKNEVLYAIELNNYAQVEAALGRKKGAERAYRMSIEIWERKLGHSHQFVALGVSNLAELYASEHREARAEKLYAEAIAINREVLGAESPQMARDLNNLGAVYFHSNKISEAENLFEQALRISRNEGSAGAVQTALEELNLAAIYQSRGEYEKCEALYRDAVPVLQKSWGKQRPQLAAVLEQYAAVLRARRNFAEAERVEVDATRIRVENAIHG